jgi:Zn finger protein HypA/HybF involved in hydrogenase expression
MHVDLLASMKLLSLKRGEPRNMPQRVQCQKCGSLLYEGIELTPPDEIIQRFDGRCPKCGKKLSFEHGNVNIKAVNYKPPK